MLTSSNSFLSECLSHQKPDNIDSIMWLRHSGYSWARAGHLTKGERIYWLNELINIWFILSVVWVMRYHILSYFIREYSLGTTVVDNLVHILHDLCLFILIILFYSGLLFPLMFWDMYNLTGSFFPSLLLPWTNLNRLPFLETKLVLINMINPKFAFFWIMCLTFTSDKLSLGFYNSIYFYIDVNLHILRNFVQICSKCQEILTIKQIFVCMRLRSSFDTSICIHISVSIYHLLIKTPKYLG